MAGTVKGSLFSAAFLVALSGVLCARPSDPEKSLVQAAEKEGELVVYATPFAPNLDLLKAFAAKYPRIKVHPIIDGGPGIIERFERSEEGPRDADLVMRCEHPPAFNRWFDRGWLANLNTLSGYERYPAWAREKEGKYIRFAGFQHGLLFNSKILQERDLPRRYPDLLKAQWKGKFFLPPREGFGGFLERYLLQEGITPEALEKQGQPYPRNTKQGIAMNEALLNGKTPMAMIRRIDLADWNQKYPQMKFHVLEDSPYQYADFGLASKAKHTAAGRLFAEWMLSNEARKVMDRAMNGESIENPAELKAHGNISVDIEHNTFAGPAGR